MAETYTTRYGARDAKYGYGSVGSYLEPVPYIVYGNSVTTRYLTWVLEIDWDNNGVFDFNEASRMYHLEVFTGRQNFLKSSGGFQEVDVGEFTAHLRNIDGRYDPYNTSSPLYGNILPGRRFRLMVKDEFNNILQPIMTGRLDDVRPIYGLVDNVKITGSNGIKEMSARQKSTDVHTVIRYDDALEVLLADWPGGMDIDTTVSEAMPYWWASNRSQFAEANDISNAILGMFCIAEDGKATYKSKVSPDAPIVFITGNDIDDDYGIRIPMLWDAIKNKVRVYVKARLYYVDVELWRLSEVMYIPAGQSRTIWADFLFNGEGGVAYSVTSPVSTTDYVANSASDGSGSNLTSSLSITVSPFATKGKLVYQNTGGTGLYVTLSKLRGDALVADKNTYSEDQNDDSIEQFGEFPLEIKTDWLQDINTATDHVSILLNRLSSINQFPRIRLRPNPSLQFAIRLFGLARVAFSSRSIFGEFRIGYYKHTWKDELGEVVDTEIYLEPNFLQSPAGTWIFPAVFGTSTTF